MLIGTHLIHESEDTKVRHKAWGEHPLREKKERRGPERVEKINKILMFLLL